VGYRKDYYSQEHVKERQRIHAQKYRDSLKNDMEKHKEFRLSVNLNRAKFLQFHPCKKVAKSLKNRDKASTVTAFEVWKIVRRQKGKCALSGVKLTSENISPDHIECLAKGGTSVTSNIRLVTKNVNLARHMMNDEEFIEMCQNVVDRYKNSVTLTP
jgi:hypothetical protein